MSFLQKIFIKLSHHYYKNILKENISLSVMIVLIKNLLCIIQLNPDEQLTMIYSCIDELETINTKKFEDLCKEKLKIISEFLKLTVNLKFWNI